MSTGPLLEISDLHVSFAGDETRVTTAVQGVGLEIERGRTLGLVGESGSGKSVTALSIMRLLPKETAQIQGRVTFDGRELLSLSERAMQDLRGNRMAMIFQEPMTSLNPSYTVGDQIGETLQRHRGMNRSEARRHVITLLERVRIPSAAARVDEYPHKLSGGMRQRVMIAMALACEPVLLIADEPTTALDVTIQAQILDLLRTLQTESGTAILLITHDLGVVAEMADDVAVMYAGEIVERGPVADVLAAPEHPYTVGLLGSIPRLEVQRRRLSTIKGMVPNLTATFIGCRFAPRCPFAEDRCRSETQALRDVSPGRRRLSRCWKAPLTELVA